MPQYHTQSCLNYYPRRYDCNQFKQISIFVWYVVSVGPAGLHKFILIVAQDFVGYTCWFTWKDWENMIIIRELFGLGVTYGNLVVIFNQKTELIKNSMIIKTIFDIPKKHLANLCCKHYGYCWSNIYICVNWSFFIVFVKHIYKYSETSLYRTKIYRNSL